MAMMYRCGWSFICSRHVLRVPHMRQSVVFMSSKVLSKAANIVEREKRRTALHSASLLIRLEKTIRENGLNKAWIKFDEEREIELTDGELILPTASKYWREQLMVLLSYHTDDIFPQVKNFEVGKSLYNHCLNISDSLSRYQLLSLSTNFIAHCIQNAPQEEKEKLILDSYKTITKTTQVFDKSSDIIIRGLADTKEWRKCREIIEHLEEHQNIPVKGINFYSPYLRAALENGDTELAWALLDKLDSKNLVPNDEVYMAFISTNDVEMVEYFLNICREKKWLPSKDAACVIMDWFENNHSKQWVGSFATAQRDRCDHCSQPLDLHKELTPEEFSALRDEMMKNTFQEDQVYSFSTPEEVQHFQTFLSHRAGWDVVIDGLNELYKFGVGKNKKSMAERMLNLVKDLNHRLNKRVCIITKAYVQAWHPPTFKAIEEIADVFYTRNDSDDDRFCLIAALSSNVNTMIVSKDFFRQHSHLISDPKQKEHIIRWQRTHQMVLKDTGPGKFIYKIPPKHDFCIQSRSGESWHIPYVDSGSMVYGAGTNASSASNRRHGRASFASPNHWICLRLKAEEKRTVDRDR